MKRLYQLITEQQFSRCHKQDKYKKLLFSLCFFHSVLLERRKFLMLGWNIQYGFNDSDFEVSENLLSIYLDEYEETPWDALKYLVSLAFVGRIDIRFSNPYRTSAIFTDIWHFSDISLDLVNSSPRFLSAFSFQSLYLINSVEINPKFCVPDFLLCRHRSNQCRSRISELFKHLSISMLFSIWYPYKPILTSFLSWHSFSGFDMLLFCGDL